MAINSELKRRRATSTGLKSIFVLPIPDGAVDNIDRAHMVFTYFEGVTTTATRYGYANVVELVLKADTGTLYGSGKLINSITTNRTEFERSHVDVGTPYKMYLNIESKEVLDVRSQNVDESYTCMYRIEGLTVDPETAAQNLDVIEERIAVVLNTQMWTGENFRAYMGAANINFIDMEMGSSDHTIDTKDNRTIVEAEGTIEIFHNRDRV